MGAPMAANVARAGYPLTIYNRTPGKAAKLIEKCFGDPAVLESMRVFLGEVSKKLA